MTLSIPRFPSEYNNRASPYSRVLISIGIEQREPQPLSSYVIFFFYKLLYWLAEQQKFGRTHQCVYSYKVSRPSARLTHDCHQSSGRIRLMKHAHGRQRFRASPRAPVGPLGCAFLAAGSAAARKKICFTTSTEALGNVLWRCGGSQRRVSSIRGY